MFESWDSDMANAYMQNKITYDVAVYIWDICKISPDHGNAVIDLIGIEAYAHIVAIVKNKPV